jgi:hypothetical protein
MRNGSIIVETVLSNSDVEFVPNTPVADSTAVNPISVVKVEGWSNY